MSVATSDTATSDTATSERNSADTRTSDAPHADTNQHYDLDPDIFGMFLDPLRKYSSGLFTVPTIGLEEAQIAKLHFVADRLGVEDGSRLLDVGCGWGSLVLFMARVHHATVVGVSPAGKQHAFIARRAAELGVGDIVSTVQGHFEDLELPRGGFDGLSMLGSIVHMPDLDHVMGRAAALLRTGGRFYVSESCFRNAALRARFDAGPGLDFVRQAIFGWGAMRPLSDLVRAAEDAGFSVLSVDDLTTDYKRTIEFWLENVAIKAAAIDAVRPGTAAELTRYLEVANAGWGYTTKHYALTCRKGR